MLSLTPILRTIALKSGPFSFLFVILVTYWVFTLVVLRMELFGLYCAGDHDIPLDTIREEFTPTVHQIYLNTSDGQAPSVHDASFAREDLKSLPLIVDSSTYSDVAHQKLILRKPIQKFL